MFTDLNAAHRASARRAMLIDRNAAHRALRQRAMFIDRNAAHRALRQEGNVDFQVSLDYFGTNPNISSILAAPG